VVGYKDDSFEGLGSLAQFLFSLRSTARKAVEYEMSLLQLGVTQPTAFLIFFLSLLSLKFLRRIAPRRRTHGYVCGGSDNASIGLYSI
jgi:hypothetical protein